MKFKRLIRLLLLISYSIISTAALRGEVIIDLSGKWNYILPDAPVEIPAEGTLSLPGTLDTNGIGIPVPVSESTDNLSRKFTYTGRASFSREVEIPHFKKGSEIILSLERTRPASVKVDGIDAGFSNLISAPQTYNLTDFLSPGRHRIEITVDNGESIPAAIRSGSNACSESTQTNWNGIIGDLSLRILPPVRFSNVSVFSSADSSGFDISAIVRRGDATGKLTAVASAGGEEISVTLNEDEASVNIFVPVDPTQDWSEWSPRLHDILLSLKDASGQTLDARTIRSGVKKFTTDGRHFLINGKKTFLRGRHDACVAPLTGHAPMDIDYWRRYFSILKDYGLNHVRFHSWCPPEACFAAADELGFYLQPELSIWGEIDKDQTALLKFLNEDMEGIMEAYGHHPSFSMFAVGNELWGETDLMKEYIDRAREALPGLLATYGSNVYLGMKGDIEGEDYLVTTRVGSDDTCSTQVRGSFSFADDNRGGLLNSTRPNTATNFNHGVYLSSTPVISHEVGQYQIYPDYSSISKYKGVTRPDNLSTFLSRAEAAGTVRKAQPYAKASGEWATRLYKEEMEMAMRTGDMAGFQLMDLQDYPGQGTALVGILDPFMDSKGLITAREWRQSCDEVVLMALLPRRTFTSGEEATVGLSVANYSGKELMGDSLTWHLPFANGAVPLPSETGIIRLPDVCLTIPEVDVPKKMTLSLKIPTKEYVNEYDIWVYPADVKKESKKVSSMAVTTSIDEALAILRKGGNVILCPDSASVSSTTIGSLFTTDFWNYRMYDDICRKMGTPSSPGTLGLLINDTHPLFNLFPTDSHTDWQWWGVVNNSYPLITDRLPSTFDPIAEPIDNIDRQYRLGLIMEFNVGKGKLLLIMADMEKASAFPEGKWLLQSAKEYLASKDCRPRISLSEQQLLDLLTRPSAERLIREVNSR